MVGTLVERQLDVTFTLQSGSFDTGDKSLTLRDLRISAKIAKAGGYAMGSMQCAIYGMTQSQMNQLSTLGNVPTANATRNTITLQAGDSGSGQFATVFEGTITNAYGNFAGAPDVPFLITAQIGSFGAVMPTKPSSFKGGTDAAQVLEGLAGQMGWKFENNGVSTQLSNPYFAGSPREQIIGCIKAAGCDWNGGDNGVLAIWPPGKGREGGTVEIGPNSGMRGYPAFTKAGIIVDMLFNPQVSLGTKLKVTSSLQPAAGEWIVYGMDIDLETQTPNGAWFSKLSASKSNLVVASST